LGAGEMAVGYWKAVMMAYQYQGAAATTKELLFGSKRLNKIGINGFNNVISGAKDKEGNLLPTEEMNDFYTKNIAHARRDAWAIFLLSTLSTLLLGYIRQKDDDDEEIPMVVGNAIRVIWGVKGETASMLPIGGGSDEYIKNFTTAIPFVRELQKVNNAVDHAFKYGLVMAYNGGVEPDPELDGMHYEYYKDAFYTKKSGPYEAGTAKSYKDFMDLTGLKNFRDLLEPGNRIDQMKRGI